MLLKLSSRVCSLELPDFDSKGRTDALGISQFLFPMFYVFFLNSFSGVIYQFHKIHQHTHIYCTKKNMDVILCSYMKIGFGGRILAVYPIGIDGIQS